MVGVESRRLVSNHLLSRALVRHHTPVKNGVIALRIFEIMTPVRDGTITFLICVYRNAMSRDHVDLRSVRVQDF